MKLKISQKLMLYSGGLAVLLLINAALSFITISLTKINGDMYNEIILGKDLVADILPPPEYIIEPFLICNQLIFEENDKKCDDLFNVLHKLKADYIERHQYWQKHLENGELKKTFVQDSYSPAEDFFSIVETKYIPALRRKEIDEAKRILALELNPKYEVHRKAIDKVVELAAIENKTIEQNANSEIDNSILVMISITLLSFVFSIVISIITIRSIINPIKIATKAAIEISKGNFETINKYYAN